MIKAGETKTLKDGDEATTTGETRIWGGEEYVYVRKTKDRGKTMPDWVISRKDWDALDPKRSPKRRIFA